MRTLSILFLTLLVTGNALALDWSSDKKRKEIGSKYWVDILAQKFKCQDVLRHIEGKEGVFEFFVTGIKNN